MAKKEVPILNLSDAGHKKLLIAHIKALEGLHRIEIVRCRDQRSLAQQGYLWGVVYPVIANGLTESWQEKWDSDRVHSHLRDRFLRVPTINRNTGEVTGYETLSTQALDMGEFGLYIENCVQFGLDYAGVDVPPPSKYGLDFKVKSKMEAAGPSRAGSSSKRRWRSSS
jgi:hypothetical protein